MANSFQSKIFIVPGLGNSEEQHWQTLWEKEFGFTRIQQRDWETPVRADWVSAIDETLKNVPLHEVILVGHSLACSTIVFWCQQYQRRIKGALLVAPSDTEGAAYPPGTSGFMPMPLSKLIFPSITITSVDDQYVSIDRASHFANAWGSELVNIGSAGHINVASGHGSWTEGLKFLERLDRL